MKGRIEQTSHNGAAVHVYFPQDYRQNGCRLPAVYALDGDVLFPKLPEIFGKDGGASFILVGVTTPNRLDDYTPWPAPALNPKFGDFGGKADCHLEYLTLSLKPWIDRAYRTMPEPSFTGIAGYSLGGLLAVYALYATNAYGHIASLSGSFWYEGWLDFIAGRSPAAGSQAFLAAGENEGAGEGDIKRNAAQNTEKTYCRLRDALGRERVAISWDKGGHRQNVVERYRRAFEWLNLRLRRNSPGAMPNCSLKRVENLE